MIRKMLVIVIFLLLTGCSNDGGTGSIAKDQKYTGMFSGSVAGKEYKIGVRCTDFNKDYFRFLSDRTDVSDTNGDGIVLSGLENNGKLVLTIIDNGKTLSAGNVNFTKGNNKAQGSGKLFESSTPNVYDIKFTVTCD